MLQRREGPLGEAGLPSREATIMKAIPTTPAVKRVDASLDTKLNPVELANNEIVSWGAAFPRPSQGASPRVAKPAQALSTKTTNPIWRTDATMGSVLGTLGRDVSAPSID
jgi:hypothetical protein